MGFSLRGIVRSVGRVFASPFEIAGHLATGQFGEALRDVTDSVSNFGGMPSSGGGAAPAAPDLSTGRIGEGEAQDIAAKRLSRLGRYFTSPLGILSNANTASQRLFS